MIESTRDPLFANLDAVRAAALADDYARAGELLAEHDRGVRALFAPGRPAPESTRLRHLADLQRALEICLRGLRTEAAAHLRTQRQFDAARRAYHVPPGSRSHGAPDQT